LALRIFSNDVHLFVHGDYETFLVRGDDLGFVAGLDLVAVSGFGLDLDAALGSGFKPPDEGTPVFFGGAMNLPRASFLRSAAATISRG
jgi:hypothetical protein